MPANTFTADQLEKLFALIREGRATLQIPTLTLSFIPDIPSEELTLNSGPFAGLPVSWFCHKNSKNIPTRRSGGYLFWTRAGWEANKETFIAVFREAVAAVHGACSETDVKWFVKAVEAELERTQKAIDSERARLTKALKALEGMTS